MQKSYRKNIQRDFRSNLNRFLSLFGIVALGVMMLTGLVSFAPSMRTAGQKYYVQQNVFDLRVLSTLGLSEEDIAAIAAVDGVEAVQPVKYQDVEAQWQGQGEPAVVRLQQLPAAQAAYDKTGEDVQVLDLTELSDVCDYFVLATGTNNRQVDSIVDEIEEKVAEACGEHPFSIEGREQKTWMLMDYGSVVVLVFAPEARDFYRLEKLWGDAPQLPLNLL